MRTVEHILANLRRAWKAGDGPAWAANFTEDADFVDVLGRVQRGRDTIAREHQKIFDSIYRNSLLDVHQLSSSSLGDGVLLVHTASKLQVPAGPRAGDTHAVQTMLLVGGLVRAFQNTLRTAMADFAGTEE